MIDYRNAPVAAGMMEIGIMRVLVPHEFMAMPMRMRLAHRSVMGMLVMAVVRMCAIVFQSLMRVIMIMPFR